MYVYEARLVRAFSHMVSLWGCGDVQAQWQQVTIHSTCYAIAHAIYAICRTYTCIYIQFLVLG